MPTSSVVPQTVTNRQPTSLSFQSPHTFRPPVPMICTISHEALGTELVGFNGGSFTSSTYPASSRVLAYPFHLADPFLVRKVFWGNGTTASTDSADVGVYTEDGATLLVSGGPTLIGTSNTIQEKDCTDTLLQPGRYWCAYVQGGTTATPLMSPTPVIDLRCAGAAQMAGSGSTLGSTFTPAAIASAVFPLMGISSRTLVG